MFRVLQVLTNSRTKGRLSKILFFHPAKCINPRCWGGYFNDYLLVIASNLSVASLNASKDPEIIQAFTDAYNLHEFGPPQWYRLPREYE